MVTRKKTNFNRLWKLAKSSIIHDPSAGLIQLGKGSYRLNLRDGLLLDREGGSSRSLELYYNLISDATVYTSLDRIKTLICNFEQAIIVGDEDDDKSQLAAEWIEKEFRKKKSLIRKIKETLALSFLIGLSGVEIIWELEGGKTTIGEIIPLDSRRLVYTLETDDNETTQDYCLRILTDHDLFEGEKVPERKFITQTYYTIPIDSPYGLGVGQQIYWLVEFKKCALELWVQISDRYSMPIVVGKVPDNTDGDLVDDFFTSLKDMAANGTFVIPDDFDIVFSEADTKNADTLIQQLINYCDAKIREVMLGESSTSTSELKPGLAGAAREARAVTIQKAKAIADEIVNTINNTLIKWLTIYNFPGATPPRMLLDSNDTERLEDVAGMLLTLSNVGFTADPTWIEEKFGIPRKKDVEGLGDIIEAPPEIPGTGEDINQDGDISQEEEGGTGLGEVVKDPNDFLKKQQPDEIGEPRLTDKEKGETFDSREFSGLNPNNDR